MRDSETILAERLLPDAKRAPSATTEPRSGFFSSSACTTVSNARSTADKSVGELANSFFTTVGTAAGSGGAAGDTFGDGLMTLRLFT